jgi:PilZ domain
MPNQPEPRVDVDLLVRVFGMGADGRPFLQNAHAHNISNHGAKLSGIEHQLKAGEVIGVQFGDKKGRFKVVWVIDAGHLRKTEAGVQLVDGQQCPWLDEMLKSESAVAPAKSDESSDKNQRKFPRHRVPFPIEIRTERSSGTHMRTQATDISGRGCYVESLLPLPAGTALNITFWLEEQKITAPSVVRTCDGGVGMGIEFTGLDLGTQERLQKQVEKMGEESDTARNAQGAS